MTQSSFDEDRCQMVCLLGTSGAGKTSSLKVLKTDGLPATESTPIVNFQSYTWVSPQSRSNHLRVWDCSGFVQIRSLAHLHLKRSKGVLVFYNSLTRNTFDDLQMWIDLAISQKIQQGSIWIIRTEFRSQQNQNTEEAVSQLEGIRFAEKSGLQHRTLSQYKTQSVKDIYEEFGNKIIDQHLESYMCHQLIRRSVSYVEKIPPPQMKTDTYLYFGLGSFLLGLIVLGAIHQK